MEAKRQNVLEMKNITMEFFGVKALGGVDFDVRGGEVHALCGANGAGKSTLIKILGGNYPGYQGDILLNGKPVEIRSPAKSRETGVEIVYQEVDTVLVPYLSVAENLALDRLALGKIRWVQWNKINKFAREALARIRLNIDVRKQVSELSLHERQMVCIARSLTHDSKFIIFDEPTAPLSIKETQQLLALIRELKQQGYGIIYVSHRLDEVTDIADRVTVFRDGKNVGTLEGESITIREIVHRMLGGNLEEEFPKVEAKIGKEVLSVSNLSSGNKVRDVSLTLREGEILGITGLVGSGKTELARILFGADPYDSGKIEIDGKPVRMRSPADAIAKGVALVPEERRHEGLIIDMPIRENLSAASIRKLSKGSFINRKKENEQAEKLRKDLRIKCHNISQVVKYLSGGNQQKVVVGKWLATNGKIFMFDEPTKGVDIGAKSEIYRLIGDIAQSGKSVIFFSSETPEILGICDRILVMNKGRIVAELDRKDATNENLLYYSTGGTDDNVKPSQVS